MGIMRFANTALKNLINKPVTTDYPKKEKINYDLTRGHIEIDIDNCIFCGLCGRKCPTSSITVDRPNKTWQIDRLKCIQCGYCSESCPKKCLAMKNEYIKATEEDIKDKYSKE